MLLRCLNQDCSDADDGAPPVFDYEGADAAAPCPKCGATMKTHRHGVVERACIHYLVVDDAGKIRTPNGRRGLACDPAAARMPEHATSVTAAVSCPACQRSAVFGRHVAGNVDQSQRIVLKDMPPVIAGGTFTPGGTLS